MIKVWAGKQKLKEVKSVYFANKINPRTRNIGLVPGGHHHESNEPYSPLRVLFSEHYVTMGHYVRKCSNYAKG